MTARPAVVAFDVIDTLMSIEPLRGKLTAAGQPPHLLEIWYARTLRDGMALSAAGDYADFPAVAEAALRGLAGRSAGDEQVAAVIVGLGELPAFPDALPAVRSLAEAGVRVVCLTNGRADSTEAFAARAGLQPFVERVISAGEVLRWKPSTVVYRYAAEVLGVWPERMALVAAHDWDCHGAKRAGMITGWVRRSPGSGGYGECFAPPDVTGADLAEVAAKLLAVEP